MCGTMSWTAPEMIERSVKAEYAEKVDIYSFAMVMFETITHAVPWDGISPPLVVSNVVNGKRPEIPNVSAPAWYVGLMKDCWNSAASNRPSFEQILETLSNN